MLHLNEKIRRPAIWGDVHMSVREYKADWMYDICEYLLEGKKVSLTVIPYCSCCLLIKKNRMLLENYKNELIKKYGDLLIVRKFWRGIYLFELKADKEGLDRK